MVGNRETDRAGARGGRQAHPGSRPEQRGTPGTVAPGDHATGAPVGVPDHGDDGREQAAMHGPPDGATSAQGHHTGCTAHGARHLAPEHRTKGRGPVFTARANAPETLDGIDRERERDGQCTEDVARAHGRMDRAGPVS